MEIHSLKQGGEILSFTRTKQDFQVHFYRPAGLYFPIPCRPASQWSCTAHSPAVPPRSSLLPSQLCRSGWWLDWTNWKVFSKPSDSVNPASTQHWLIHSTLPGCCHCTRILPHLTTTSSPIPPPPPPLLILLLYSPCSVQYSSFVLSCFVFFFAIFYLSFTTEQRIRPRMSSNVADQTKPITIPNSRRYH